jgi:hypothetical protein
MYSSLDFTALAVALLVVSKISPISTYFSCQSFERRHRRDLDQPPVPPFPGNLCTFYTILPLAAASAYGSVEHLEFDLKIVR